MFRHPKYYKELRKRALDERNRDPHVRPISGSADSATDQVISDGASTEATSVHPDPGLKPQATSLKQQASSAKIPDPGKSFTHPEPRCSTKIKLLRGCFTWKAI